MTDRTTLSIPDETVERLEAHKQDGESWPAFAARVADQLDDLNADDEDGEHTMNTLTVADVREIIRDEAPHIAREAGREVEDRLSRR